MSQSFVTRGDVIAKISAKVLFMETFSQSQLSTWGGLNVLHQEQECDHDFPEQNSPCDQSLPADIPQPRQQVESIPK